MNNLFIENSKLIIIWLQFSIQFSEEARVCDLENSRDS